MKKALTIALVILLALPFAFANGSSEKAGKVRDTLNYGLPQEPGKLDPQNDSLLVSKFLCKNIYDTLLHLNGETKEIEPNLATEWVWEDELTLVLTLRDDVYFHNGEKMTAEDVLYTFQRCKTGTVSANFYKSFDIDASYVVDPTHIVVKFKTPYAAALNVLANVSSSIVCKSYAESVDSTTFYLEPIGTGAYKFVEWDSGDHITLTRNDNYWGEKANIPNVLLRIINDNSARCIELETGGIDITDSLNFTDVSKLADVEGLNAYFGPSLKVMYLSLNENKPYFKDERVRQAIAYAIDTEKVLASAYGGGAARGTSSLPSSLFGYKNEGFYEYNPELSRQLLKEAGYPNGFTFTCVCPSVAASIKTAESVQAFLSEVGITMKIEEYDAATWMGKKLRDSETDCAPYVFTADTYDPDQAYMNMFAGSGYSTVSKTDETLNALLQAGRAETDVEKRKAIYAEVQDYIHDHFIVIPLVENYINYAYSDAVKGFVPDAGVQLDLKKLSF